MPEHSPNPPSGVSGKAVDKSNAENTTARTAPQRGFFKSEEDFADWNPHAESLDRSALEFAKALDLAKAPTFVRCLTCQGLLLNAFRGSCCDTSICELCKRLSQDPRSLLIISGFYGAKGECPMCAQKPYNSDIVKPSISSRRSVKAWLKSVKAKAVEQTVNGSFEIEAVQSEGVSFVPLKHHFPNPPNGVIGRAVDNFNAEKATASTAPQHSNPEEELGAYAEDFASPESAPVSFASQKDPDLELPADPELPKFTQVPVIVRVYVLQAFKAANAYLDKANEGGEKENAKALEQELLSHVDKLPPWIDPTEEDDDAGDSARPEVTQSDKVDKLTDEVLGGVLGIAVIGIVQLTILGLPSMVFSLTMAMLALGFWTNQGMHAKESSPVSCTEEVAANETAAVTADQIIHKAHTHLLNCQLTYHRYRATNLATSFANLDATCSEVLGAKIQLESEKRRLFRQVQSRSTQLSASLDAQKQLEIEVQQLRNQQIETEQLLTPELRDQIEATLTLAEVNKMKEELTVQAQQTEKAKLEVEEKLEDAIVQRDLYEELKLKQDAINKLECKAWTHVRTLAAKETQDKYDVIRKKEEDEIAAAIRTRADQATEAEGSILKGEKFTYRKGFQMAPGAPRMTAAERWEAKRKEDKQQRWALVLKNRDNEIIGKTEEQLEKELEAEIDKKGRAPALKAAKRGRTVLLLKEKESERVEIVQDADSRSEQSQPSSVTEPNSSEGGCEIR
jgi:hypothetical protein